ncbi:c2 domain containing protein [Aeromonas phage AhSzw-1]|uniref:C2 domain containing protein n=1 Tax=Aeromonas phage AhSzw-1 TaxID=2138299 RepID=A0A2R4AM96_9CAUD|nr:c2 domain containing protein [Aeromonas phage AhSzw-1]AVR76126.1 c2 domain containing protein [Aeromonas phage AhSzw-1]
MNYAKKIAKKQEKISKLQLELAQLVMEFQDSCTHTYVPVRHWDDDDGYSKRLCTHYTEFRCVHCKHTTVEAKTFNS